MEHFDDVPGVESVEQDGDTYTVSLYNLTTGVRVALKNAREDGWEIDGLEDCDLVGGGTIEVHR